MRDGILWLVAACRRHEGQRGRVRGRVKRFVAAHPDHPGTVALLLTSDEEGDGRSTARRKVAETLAARHPDRLVHHRRAVLDRASGRPAGSAAAEPDRHAHRASSGQGHVAYPDKGAIRSTIAAPAPIRRRARGRGLRSLPPTSLHGNVHAAPAPTTSSRAKGRFNLRYNPHWDAPLEWRSPRSSIDTAWTTLTGTAAASPSTRPLRGRCAVPRARRWRSLLAPAGGAPAAAPGRALHRAISAVHRGHWSIRQHPPVDEHRAWRPWRPPGLYRPAGAVAVEPAPAARRAWGPLLVPERSTGRAAVAAHRADHQHETEHRGDQNISIAARIAYRRAALQPCMRIWVDDSSSARDHHRRGDAVGDLLQVLSARVVRCRRRTRRRLAATSDSASIAARARHQLLLIASAASWSARATGAGARASATAGAIRSRRVHARRQGVDDAFEVRGSCPELIPAACAARIR